MEEKNNPPAKPARKKGLILLLVLLLLGGILVGGVWVWHRWQYVSTDDAQVKGNLVSLSPKVPGRILKLLVDEGAVVKKDQVLFELDKDDYQAALAQAGASLEKSRQELAQAVAILSLTRERVSQGIGTAQASLHGGR